MIDAHCHLDQVGAALPAVLQRARAVGVTGFVLAGVGPEGWPVQERLATAHAGLWRTVGLHPWWVQAATDAQLEAGLTALGHALDHPGPAPPVALGELGLDRAAGRGQGPAWARQQRALRLQLALARARALPVVLHVVQAHGAALALLEAEGPPPFGGMVHAFGGAPEVAARYLALGLHLSLAGPVTHPARQRLRRAVPTIPPERLLLETDTPDQCAEPWASRARAAGRPPRSEPAHLVDIAAAVATLREEHPTVLARQATANTRALFALPHREPSP